MGDSMRKYAILVISILAIVIFASGCTSETQNKTYNLSGIYFNYPGAWNELSSDQINLTSGSATAIVAVSDDSGQTGVLIQSTPSSSQSLTDFVNLNKASIKKMGYTILSENTTTVNGVKAHQIIFNGNDTKQVMTLFKKNNKVYYIVFNSPPGDFDSQQTNYDMILDSFKVQ
jgi:hypothetical protein